MLHILALFIVCMVFTGLVLIAIELVPVLISMAVYTAVICTIVWAFMEVF